jgi:hypothetical protein
MLQKKFMCCLAKISHYFPAQTGVSWQGQPVQKQIKKEKKSHDLGLCLRGLKTEIPVDSPLRSYAPRPADNFSQEPSHFGLSVCHGMTWAIAPPGVP